MSDKKDEDDAARYERAVKDIMKRYDLPEWAAKRHLDHWS